MKYASLLTTQNSVVRHLFYSVLCVALHAGAESKPHMVLAVNGHEIHQTAPESGIKFLHRIRLCQCIHEGFDHCPSGFFIGNGGFNFLQLFFCAVKPGSQSIVALFYQNDVLIAMTRELTEMLRKNRTIDWQRKETARAGMRKMVKRLLKRYEYPPEGVEDAINTVISQCELWTDSPVDGSPN